MELTSLCRASPPVRAGLVGLLVLLQLAGATAAAATLVGRPAPGWALNDLGGSPRRLEEWRGQWVLLKLGRTVCPDCAREFSELEKVRNRIETLGVQVLDIFLYEDRYTVKKYIEKTIRNFRPTVLYDWTSRTTRDYGVSIIPHLVLVDPAGIIVWESNYLNGPKLAESLETHVGSGSTVQAGNGSE